MKPKHKTKLRKQVDEAFNVLIEEGSLELFTDEVLIGLKDIYPNMAWYERDYRQGEETYGYNPETIHDNLIYISDRWCCAYRVCWLIGFLEKYKQGELTW